MGSVTEEKKKELFKKLSQGFAHVLQQQQHLRNNNNKNLSLLGQPIIPFKEIKHNVLLLSDDDDPNLISDICEDIGVSIIEADFTWNSNAVNYSNDPNNLLLQYAWNQCPNPRELPTAWLENQLKQHIFTGYMHPEVTPNGIDLCVYFYDGPSDEIRTKDDLELLCLLRKLGIYVLPLTTTRDESIKSHFADLLTEYKVRCLDLGNLEVGKEPSFFHKPSFTATSPNTAKIDRLSRLQGLECTQLNVPRVATYQILAVDQFCGIENNAIFQLLKRTRERQVMRDEMKEELQRQQQQQKRTDNDMTEDDDLYSIASTSILDTISSSNISISKKDDSLQEDNFFVSRIHSNSKDRSFNSSSKLRNVYIILPVLFTFVMGFYYYVNYRDTQIQQQQILQHWTVSFDVDPTIEDIKFTLFTRDHQGNLNWPKNTPLVWLNHVQTIPIEKVDESPGQYQLLFDPFTTTANNTKIEKFIQFAFHVNTTTSTLPIDDNQEVEHIVYSADTPSSATYVLFNSQYNKPSKSKVKGETATTTKSQSDHEKKSNSSPLLSSQESDELAQDENDLNMLEKIPKAFAFFRKNYHHFYRIIINTKN